MKQNGSGVWWFKSVIPPFRKLRQEDLKFKASMGGIAISCLKKILGL
jgi:hypothetical protein